MIFHKKIINSFIILLMLPCILSAAQDKGVLYGGVDNFFDSWGENFTTHDLDDRAATAFGDKTDTGTTAAVAEGEEPTHPHKRARIDAGPDELMPTVSPAPMSLELGVAAPSALSVPNVDPWEDQGDPFLTHEDFLVLNALGESKGDTLPTTGSQSSRRRSRHTVEIDAHAPTQAMPWLGGGASAPITFGLGVPAPIASQPVDISLFLADGGTRAHFATTAAMTISSQAEEDDEEVVAPDNKHPIKTPSGKDLRPLLEEWKIKEAEGISLTRFSRKHYDDYGYKTEDSLRRAIIRHLPSKRKPVVPPHERRKSPQQQMHHHRQILFQQHLQDLQV